MLELYKLFLLKEKTLLMNLNKIKRGDKISLGMCWIPAKAMKKVQLCLNEIALTNKDINIPQFVKIPHHTHGLKPPTLFKLNDFTWAF
jgi:vacuolar-type H+-ATPase subunit I/STV1